MDNPAGLGFEPEAFVDISAMMDTKRRMLLKHQSQDTWIRAIYDGASILDLMENAATRGAAAGVAFAEGFREVKTFPRTGSFGLLPGMGA